MVSSAKSFLKQTLSNSIINLSILYPYSVPDLCQADFHLLKRNAVANDRSAVKLLVTLATGQPDADEPTRVQRHVPIAQDIPCGRFRGNR